MRKNSKGFTVLELMVGIVIFTLGFLGAYLLIESTNSVSLQSRDEIIGSNIMREQIELLKNLRDTNWIQFKNWNSIELAKLPIEMDTTLKTNTYYTIENNFSWEKNIRIKKLINFSNEQNSILSEFQKTNTSIRLCIDSLGRYTHDCNTSNTKTNFASFLFLEPLVTQNTNTNVSIPVEKAYKVTVFFVSFAKWYRIQSMSTIITDWKNQ